MHIGIVGAGPAGLFAADFLSKDSFHRIEIYERRALPFGLLRYGVAPDHAGTKAIARQFERTLDRSNVSLHCGVEVGSRIALSTLLARHDHLVLASGAGAGHRLPHPLTVANELTGLDFLRWVNGDPQLQIQLRGPVRNVLVVGNGNVALDVVRLLARAGSGVPGAAAGDWLACLDLQELQVWGRGAAGSTRFSPQGLLELDGLARFRPCADPCEVTGAGSNPEAGDILARWAGAADDGRRPIRFRFARPLTPDDGFAPDLLVHCVGQAIAPIAGQAPAAWRASLPPDRQARVHLAGWAAEGGAGAIPLSRAQARAMCDRILAAATV